MIIQCQSCAAKYFLPEEKVPVNPVKVRCPKCRAVFMLAGKRAPVVEVAPVVEAAEEMIAAPAPSPVMPPARPVEMPVAPAMEAPVAQTAVAEEPTVVEAPLADLPVAEAPVAEPARPSRGGKSADDRAKRLARVLVSDILWYNRERRDAALRDGTLMTSLGEEIKKSWELYKEKVGPEAAQSTNYFKEALNEILANGQQVF